MLVDIQIFARQNCLFDTAKIIDRQGANVSIS